MNGSLSLAQIIVQLNKANETHLTCIVSGTNDNHELYGKKLCSINPIFDAFFEDSGCTAIIPLCSFSASENDE